MDMFRDSSIQISAEVLYTNERPTDKDWNYFSVRDYIEDSPETSDSLKSEASITLNLVEHPGGTTSMEFVSFSPATITINGDSSVNIGAFRIGKYEVTNRQYSDFMNSITIDSTGSYGNIQYIYLRNSTGIAYNGDTFVHKEGMGSMPVVNVTWPGAINFCKWMGGRLPTRLEWYYAADTSYTYSGSNTPENVAWFNGNSGGTPHEVGTKNPNSYGVYDMSGNVAEWCLNWYSQSSKLFKGGHWRSPRDDLKIIRRFHQPPLDAGNYLGFRVLIPQ
jgi:formylglycine-generating enzyme required for sulfatase activity